MSASSIAAAVRAFGDPLIALPNAHVSDPSLHSRTTLSS